MDELRIWIADDDQKILDGVELALKENIKDKDLKFSKFTNPEDLIDALGDDSTNVDLLLLDCYFPGFDTGLESLEEIRYYAPNLPIIMLTSNDNPSDFKPYTKYKFDYIQKADSIERTNTTLQIYINRALDEKNKFQNLKKDINNILAEWNPPDNIVNLVATGQFLYNEFFGSNSGIDLFFIGACWGRAFEAAVRLTVNADRSKSLGEAISMLVKKINPSRDFKNSLYTLKNKRNKFSHDSNDSDDCSNQNEETLSENFNTSLYALNAFRKKFSLKPTRKLLPTDKEILDYRDLFLGESGYTSGVLVQLLKMK